MIVFDLTLRLKLMLDGYSTDFKTEKVFKGPIIWELFATIWGTILTTGAS